MSSNASLLETCRREDGSTIQEPILFCESVNFQDDEGCTPLNVAVQAGYVNFVKQLVESGADTNFANSNNTTALKLASRNGHVEMVKLLCSNGADPNCQDRSGNTPLHHASAKGHDIVADQLLKCGAQIDMQNFKQRTSLHLAVAKGHGKVVDVLVNKGANVNLKNSRRRAPLHAACCQRYIEVVKYLVHHGAKMFLKDQHGRTPLYGRLDIARHLATNEPYVKNVTWKHEEAFHAAAGVGEEEVIKYLLEMGANINTLSKNSTTALHLAARNGHVRIVEELCTSGAAVNQADNSGQTPLHAACLNRNVEVVHVLIKHGAGLCLEDNKGRTPLFGRMDIALHLATQAPFTGNDTLEGIEAFHAAVRGGSAFVVRYLLGKGYEATLRKALGQDAIAEALSLGHYPVALDLLYATKITGRNSVYGEELVLRAWAGDIGYLRLIADTLPRGTERQLTELNLKNNPRLKLTDAPLKLLLKVYEADFPLQLFKKNVTNIKRKILVRQNSIDSLLDDSSSSFPSLECLARAVIREACRRTGLSFLKIVAQLPEIELSIQAQHFTFLCPDIVAALPDMAECLTEFFKRHEMGKVNCPRPKSTMEVCDMDDCDPSLLEEALRVPEISGTHCRIFADKAHKCPLQDNVTHNSQVTGQVVSELQALANTVRVPGWRDENQDLHDTPVIHSTAQEAMKQFLSRLSTNNGSHWSLQPTGSFYMGNKIGLCDELDYLAVTDSTGIDILPSDDPKCYFRYKATAPIKHQHGMKCSPKEYFAEGLKFYLREEWRPYVTGVGKVYVRSCYPHPRGPGVCVQLAWVCIGGHTHNLGVDLTPAIEWTERCIKDVCELPQWFNRKPFCDVKEEVSNLPVLLVFDPTTNCKFEGGKMLFTFKVSFNHTKKLIFRILDTISTNVRISFHLLKVFRDFLPERLKFSGETNDFQGSWMSGPVISSYVVYNTLLQEVVKHPSPADWADHLLPERLVSMLTVIRGLSYIDFFKGLREHSLNLDRLNKEQEDALKECIQSDVDNIIRCLRGNFQGILTTESFNAAMKYSYECRVCLVNLSQSGKVKFSIEPEGRLRYETSGLRKELRIRETDDLYYYKIPPVTPQCKGINIYESLIRVVILRYLMSSLHEAVSLGNVPVVERLLNDVNCDVNCLDRSGYTPLCVASSRGHLDVVKHLVERGVNVDMSGADGRTPLFLASLKGHAHVVRYLCSQNVDVNKTDLRNMTPFGAAALEGHCAILRILKDCNAYVDHRDAKGRTPLHLASKLGHISAVMFLRGVGSSVNSIDNTGHTPYLLASANGHWSVVKYLADSGATGVDNVDRFGQIGPGLNKSCTNGYTPLQGVVLTGNIEFAMHLIEKGADVNFPGEWSGRPPLHCAASRGDLTLVKYLYKKNANLNLLDAKGKTALCLAWDKKHLLVAQYLYDRGTSIKLPRERFPPIHWAAAQGNLNLARHLCENVSCINSKDDNGETPLLRAISCEFSNVVEYLLRGGAKTSVTDARGRTPLGTASFMGLVHMVICLLERGADINFLNGHGLPPIVEAVSVGHLSIVRLLFDKGATFQDVDNKGNDVLHYAAAGGHDKIVSFCLDHGATVDKPGSECSTPLHQAAWNGYLRVVKLLCDAGADLTKIDEYGRTPLGVASQGGHLDVVKYLIARGADVNFPGKDGDSPVHCAVIGGHMRVLRFLHERGADVNLAGKCGQTPGELASYLGHKVIIQALNYLALHGTLP